MVFSGGGFHGTPPLCTNGSAGYLMQLSVKAKLLSLNSISQYTIMVFRKKHPIVTH